MKAIELREKVLRKIEIVDDYLLREILEIIELEDIKNQVLKIPAEHKKDIEIGLTQIEAGQTVKNEEVDIRVRKWLDK